MRVVAVGVVKAQVVLEVQVVDRRGLVTILVLQMPLATLAAEVAAEAEALQALPAAVTVAPVS